MDRQQKRVLKLRNHVLNKQNNLKSNEVIMIDDVGQDFIVELANAGSKELEALTMKELKDKAKTLGLVGYSNMNKDELIEFIEEL